MTNWASRPLGGTGKLFFDVLHSHAPVSLIATPRWELQCRAKRSWRRIENDASLREFDQIPLTDERSGVIEAIYLPGEGARPLLASMFMAADAPLLAFIESADQQRFRLLLDGSEVCGLVTLSDLQKLPVYSLLFGLLMAVEMLLMEWIRKTCGSTPDRWLDHLSKQQRRKIEDHWTRARRHNVAIDRLACASLAQEIYAAAGLGLFVSGDETDKKLKALKELRDKVCHGSDIVPTAEDALKLPALARSARTLAAWLQSESKRAA